MRAPSFFRRDCSYLPWDMRQERQAEDDARWAALSMWERLKWRATIYALWTITAAFVVGVLALFWWLDHVRIVF